MATSINRTSFAKQLAADGGKLNINDLEPGLRTALQEAGVSQADLARIAGSDGQISGKAEFLRLFDRLDRMDGGSPSSITVARDDGSPTLAGEALDQLRAEIEDNRLAASHQGIIHLGMRPASAKEVDALRAVTPERAGGVHAIAAHASPGVVELDGKAFDLRDRRQLDAFEQQLVKGSLGMEPERAHQFVELLGRAQPGTADELALLGMALFQAGDGRLPVNRLVLSGHGNGTRLIGDDGSIIDHQRITQLAQLFPEGARAIDHIAFSSCFSGTNPRGLRELQAAFPSLKSLTGYAEFSPSAEKGSPAHLRRWAERSDGDDPSRMDPSAIGHGVATWNKADQSQNVPGLTPAACKKIADRGDAMIEKYPVASAKSAHDPAVKALYIEISQAVNAEGLSAKEQQRLDELKLAFYALLHPPTP